MHYQSVDKVPLEFSYAPVGFYEHGKRLNDLFEQYPGDFESFVRHPIPQIPSCDFDADGNYHITRTDEWGVTWSYRIFGIAGIPSRHPIKSPEDIEHYTLPAPVATEGTEYDAFAAGI